MRHNFSPTRSVIMFEYLGLAYGDSDYTAVIAIMY